MKYSTVLLSCLACLLVFSIALPAQAPEQPQLALGFNWDDSLQQWGDTIERLTHSYQGNLELPQTTLQERKVNGAWKKLYFTERQWNADGLMAEEYVEKWENGQWEPFYKEVFTYDPQGQLTKAVYLTDVSFGYDTSGVELYDNQYDAFGNLRETTLDAKYYGDPGFQPQWRDTRTYDSNNEMTSRKYESWFNQSWETNWFRRNIQWHDYSNNQAAQSKLDVYNSNQIIEDSLWYVYDWKPNNSYTEYRLAFDPLFIAWDSTHKRVHNFDAHGHLEVLENYLWESSLNTWRLLNGDLRTNFHTVDNHLSAYESERFGAWTTVYQKEIRWEFYNFTVGAEEAIEDASFAAWASHPVGQTAELFVDGRPGNLSLVVSSLAGKILRRIERPHAGGTQVHAFEMGLPSGLYLYDVELGGAKAAGKLVIAD